MTRKDYLVVAYSLRTSHPNELSDDDFPPLGSDEHFYEYFYIVRQWERDVMRIVTLFAREYANFNEDIFLVACGYRRRPDGAMYAFDWSKGKPI